MANDCSQAAEAIIAAWRCLGLERFMYYSGITTCDIANGDGVRVVLWCSGCSLHCPNCHNPQEQNFCYGKPFGSLARQDLYAALNHPYIAGLTLSGGHPLEQWNIATVEEVVDQVRQRFPDKTIWIYSGLTWEEIQDIPQYAKVVNKCDILVDGPFIQQYRDITLPFRGSSNQRIIDIQQSLKTNKVVERS